MSRSSSFIPHGLVVTDPFVREALQVADARPLSPSHVLIAGPTCGKTYLAQQWEGEIQDTDDVWGKWGFFREWHELPSSKSIPLAWFVRFLTHQSCGWVTNLWDKDFLNVLLDPKDSVRPVFVYRKNARLIRDIMHSRPGMTSELKLRFNLESISNWVQAWEKYAHLVSNRVIVLSDDQYLSDVVVFDPVSGFSVKPSIKTGNS